MSNGFPKRTNSSKSGEYGVELVSRVISDKFGWLFKRNHQEHDFGIDGQIEIVTDDGSVTGQMLAVQIKCGKSFVRERNKWGYVYRGEIKHFNYLANYPIPVVICICDPESTQCYWVHFQAKQTHITDAGWKITIPFENVLSSSKKSLYSLVSPLCNSLEILQDYWTLNKMIVESTVVLYLLGRDDIINADVSGPRDFFDRLRSTKELAFECQGKVEIGFCGYDDDPRELYEIKEVRDYVRALSLVLPELFFFVRTEEPNCTLLTFALCQTNVFFNEDLTTPITKRHIEFEPDKVAVFFQNHCYGLNKMTDWLNIPVEENKKITFDVLRCFGFKIPDSMS